MNLPKNRTRRRCRLHLLFLGSALSSSPLTTPKLFLPQKPAKIQRTLAPVPHVRAVDLDQKMLVAISVGVASVAVGIGIPIFYEKQIDNAAKRENTQICFPCSGSGARAPLAYDTHPSKSCWQARSNNSLERNPNMVLISGSSSQP